ncbi:MAG: DNA recombination and repair protein RecF [uncultured Thermomicrobiales bacterium]|uniref:DNA replication and repair protein RecF n=1 Tax=uncultured Thermomicrobiales bacterium TaxID=1645740 RepID=A0A6J4UDP5_9BACT|nr:MAG: DNA recombination and repair protein RecF [uncultured Thermomicrobiales bacterium]
MHLTHLELEQFRNYERLDLTIPPRGLLLHGPNASGKTSFLEALYFLATTKSPRAGVERELIRWGSGEEYGVPPYARVVGRIARRDGPAEVEIALSAEAIGTGPQGQDETGSAGLSGNGRARHGYGPNGAGRANKRIKLNGMPRRALDVVGTLKVVLFSPQDLELAIGSPSIRRRYLDITIAQVDNHYIRQLGAYNRIVEERNSLLRQIVQEGRSPDARDVEQELSYWNEELVRLGSYVVARRDGIVRSLARLAHGRFRGLSAGEQALDIVYQPGVESHALRERGGEYDLGGRESIVARDFVGQLEERRRHEYRRGVSLVGPHRDDLIFTLNGIDVGTYGSRGQQRLVVLALKLAEIDLIRDESGEGPLLLLDDAASELDPDHRRFVTETVERDQLQTILTATDLANYPAGLLPDLERLEVRNGMLGVRAEG